MARRRRNDDPARGGQHAGDNGAGRKEGKKMDRPVSPRLNKKKGQKRVLLCNSHIYISTGPWLQLLISSRVVADSP